MNANDVKEHYVTWANAMRKLKLGTNTYGYWLKQGYIPVIMQRKIEEVTKGKLKSDV